jgi:hypothetical protein
MSKILVKLKGLKPGGKCCLCGSKPAFSKKSIYCRDCSHFCARLSNARFSPEVQESLKNDVRKRRGYFCHYTQQKLDVFDYTSPYFLEFDHLVPGDPSKIVMTSAWFNEMKGDMTFKEFKGSVVQLFNYWFKGIKIKKRKFRYWYRLNPQK